MLEDDEDLAAWLAMWGVVFLAISLVAPTPMSVLSAGFGVLWLVAFVVVEILGESRV